MALGYQSFLTKINSVGIIYFTKDISTCLLRKSYGWLAVNGHSRRRLDCTHYTPLRQIHYLTGFDIVELLPTEYCRLLIYVQIPTEILSL